MARIADRFRRAAGGDDQPARIAHRFKQRGLGPDDESCSTDPLAEEESWLAALAAASVQGRIAIGPQAGQRLLKLGDRVDPEDLPARSQPLCTNIAGLGLHAGVALPARDRQRLERLCRYVARPAIAASRLSALDDGRLLYQLKERWRDDTPHVVFEPLEFIAKLAALVPAPRVLLVRYHGVLEKPSATPQRRSGSKAIGQCATGVTVQARSLLSSSLCRHHRSIGYATRQRFY